LLDVKLSAKSRACRGENQKKDRRGSWAY